MPPDKGSEPASTGSHLERYADIFSCVEVNSSFYRPHREATYARWASAVPPWFQFSVKVPRAITHDARLRQTGSPLDAFLGETNGLGDKLACLLVQLPPSLTFDAPVAHAFFEALRDRTSVPVVLEPRHGSWFTGSAYKVGRGFDVDWVYAHPRPAGSDGTHASVPTRLLYLRVHGVPDLYRSSYDAAFLEEMALRLLEAKRAGLSTWCVFDNTAHGHAVPNARDLLRYLESAATRQQPG